MIHRISSCLLVVLLAATLPGCKTAESKKSAAAAKVKDMGSQAGDVSFQAFIGRLRTAVANHDAPMLASMMTPNFGYNLNPPMEGAGVFDFWDRNGLWEELRLVVSENWGPSGNFMVAPPEFASGAEYHGYRAGVTRVGGSWKFAYFVTD